MSNITFTFFAKKVIFIVKYYNILRKQWNEYASKARDIAKHIVTSAEESRETHADGSNGIFRTNGSCESTNNPMDIEVKEYINNLGENKQYNMNKKLIRLTESDLHRIVKKSVNKILRESQFMSDEDIANQYSDMKITYFEMNPLKYHNGWKGAFELEFPNADGIDYDETMVNDFMAYDRMGNQIAWEKWMPDEQRKRLEEIIRQEIAKRKH